MYGLIADRFGRRVTLLGGLWRMSLLRASGVGMMLGVGRVGAILGPWIAGLLQDMSGSSTMMFSTIGMASFATATAAALACLPRLRPGRPLSPRPAPTAAG